MTDLTLHSTWLCATNVYWETTVQGSKGAEYTVHWGRYSEALQDRFGVQNGWQCSCKGFKFRSTCKHVEHVKANNDRCAWNAELDVTAEAGSDSNGDPCCPNCGGRVVSMRVAV